MTANPNNAEAVRPTLRIEGVDKNFGSFSALRNVSLTVAKGEFVCILGPSGCGKTTLLRIIAGLEKPDAGSVHIAGRDVTNEPVSRRGVGIVFQSYALFPNLNSIQNISFGIRRKGWTKERVRQRAMALLSLVGLEECAAKYPAQMSGGQQQRVAIARALIKKPALILADEPTANLDSTIGREILELMLLLNKSEGTTFIFSTHDQMVMDYARRLIHIHDGQIASDEVKESA